MKVWPDAESDDLVARLRDRSWCWCDGIDPSPGDCQQCDQRAEAADEIVRLRVVELILLDQITEAEMVLAEFGVKS